MDDQQLQRYSRHILLEETIDIPYPRDVFELRQTPQFAAHTQRIWKVLGNQFRNAA